MIRKKKNTHMGSSDRITCRKRKDNTMNMDRVLVVHRFVYKEGAEESARPEVSALEKWCLGGGGNWINIEKTISLEGGVVKRKKERIGKLRILMK